MLSNKINSQLKYLFILSLLLLIPLGAYSREINQPPKNGAFYTGTYRNLFAERGYNNEEINTKLEAAWDQLFYGNDSTERIYYPVDSGMAYILDLSNNDVRSEGMSYGLMISLQMDKKKEFDALWKWALKYMYNYAGTWKGYFAWHCKRDGTKIHLNPASDGEEWIVTSLYMASGRWGDGEGIYNYKAWAQTILNDMVHHEYVDLATPMFDPVYKQIVFVPEGKYAGFTDPSYHLPAFYSLWSLWSKNDKELLSEYADTSRTFFRKVVHPHTGLTPDYSNFNGTYDTGFCCNDEHVDFRYDAWRTISNIAVDYAWFAVDPWQLEACDRLQTFFAKEGVRTHGSLYKVDGTPIESDHSTGLIAMNAVASLSACNSSRASIFIDEFWTRNIPSGQYRYYDGLLYFLGMLHVSGNFKIYEPKP